MDQYFFLWKTRTKNQEYELPNFHKRIKIQLALFIWGVWANFQEKIFDPYIFLKQYLTSPYHRDICVLMCSYFLQFKFFLHSENIFKFFFIKSNTIENVFSWYWKKTSFLVKLIRESNVEDFVWQQSAVLLIFTWRNINKGQFGIFSVWIFMNSKFFLQKSS